MRLSVGLFAGRNTVLEMLKGHSPSDGVVDLDADRCEMWTSKENKKHSEIDQMRL